MFHREQSTMFLSIKFIGHDCSSRQARIMGFAKARESKPLIFPLSSHVSSLIVHHLMLKPTYASILKQPLRIKPPIPPFAGVTMRHMSKTNTDGFVLLAAVKASICSTARRGTPPSLRTRRPGVRPN